ADKIDNLD
nr:Chain D, LEDGF peptide [Homo sapiens]3AVG_F Chain F, LEDGF peptide [Homo sapiens]